LTNNSASWWNLQIRIAAFITIEFNLFQTEVAHSGQETDAAYLKVPIYIAQPRTRQKTLKKI
jgi:hypothetical protein